MSLEKNIAKIFKTRNPDPSQRIALLATVKEDLQKINDSFYNPTMSVIQQPRIEKANSTLELFEVMNVTNSEDSDNGYICDISK